MALKPIAIQDLNLNPITTIGEKWMLITAGSQQRGYNTMTASWGHLGSIWGRTSTCGPSAAKRHDGPSASSAARSGS